jgi:NADP-dependent 3-hydroxy acid dehydrogenase YdfG
MASLEGKVALVTGGTSGYGKATAKLLVKEGADVIIASFDSEEVLQSTQQEIGCKDYIHMDVTIPEDWERVHEFVKTHYGRLDMLMNIAGGGVSVRDTAEQPLDKIDYTIRVNLHNAIYGCRIFAPMMRAQKSGTIINFASVCAKEAWPGWSVYAGAKWGVLGFSKGLYTELQPDNVRVTCIIPAAASTGFQKATEGIDPAEFADLSLQAEDVAQVVVDICKLPDHVVVEDVTIWGIDQVVVPLSR